MFRDAINNTYSDMWQDAMLCMDWWDVYHVLDATIGEWTWAFYNRAAHGRVTRGHMRSNIGVVLVSNAASVIQTCVLV